MGDNPEVSEDIDDEYGVEIEASEEDVTVDPDDAAWQLEGDEDGE